MSTGEITFRIIIYFISGLLAIVLTDNLLKFKTNVKSYPLYISLCILVFGPIITPTLILYYIVEGIVWIIKGLTWKKIKKFFNQEVKIY